MGFISTLLFQHPNYTANTSYAARMPKYANHSTACNQYALHLIMLEFIHTHTSCNKYKLLRLLSY